MACFMLIEFDQDGDPSLAFARRRTFNRPESEVSVPLYKSILTEHFGSDVDEEYWEDNEIVVNGDQIGHNDFHQKFVLFRV